MSLPALSANLLAWILQSSVIALVAAALPLIFRVRHPRSQLIWCHFVLALCLVLPFVQPWVRTSATAHARLSLLPWIVLAGAAAAMLWIFVGLWRIRRCRIQSSPLYPIPDAMRAASAITNADAMFCLSEGASGPVMFGWLAPVVLLPQSFMSLGEEAQCGIACHELLHVKRGDWLVTLLEEFAGALLWFNPGAWALRSEARLAREQLVDAESVRLTEAQESYIDALLSIARGRSWSDLAPAPLFLRRSHLTQRMQRLLSEQPGPGKPRVVISYSATAALLAVTTWFTISAWPMTFEIPLTAQLSAAAHATAITPPVTPMPAAATPRLEAAAAPRAATPSPAPAFSDPWEPVAGGIQAASTPDDRAAAIAVLSRARRNAIDHASGSAPFDFRASFTATESNGAAVSGELTETWINGKKWRWTVSQSDYEVTRLLYNGQLLEDHHVTSIPMRAHMLRNQVFWALGAPGARVAIRTAQTTWHGQPATCILASRDAAADASAAQSSTRAWNEEEFCADDQDRLVVYSPAPGTYMQFTYDGAIDFHGKHLADKLITFVNGAQVISATFEVTDATPASADSLIPSPGMISTPAPATLAGTVFARLGSSAAQPGDSVRAIIHASIDSEGKVVEAEIASSSSPAFSAGALGGVKQQQFGYTGTMRQAWIQVAPANH
jgi:beta-lactamase regulating signal transducer with metallopeptidase domain